VRIDERVYAGGVGVHELAHLGVEFAGGVLGDLGKAQRAVFDVQAQHALAEDFRELAHGQASVQVHLKQAVLSGDVALGEEQVVERLGAQVRHSVLVAPNLDARVESRNANRAIELGKRLAGAPVEPRGGRYGKGRGNQDHNGQGSYNEPSQPAGLLL
jgi:ribosomal protein L30E